VQVGLLPVAYYITELVLSPFFGAVSDRWGRRGFLIVGPMLGLLQVSLFTLTPAYNPLPYLISLQLLAGVASAMTTPVVLSYLADLTVKSQAYRMRIMSFYELVTSGGIAVGTIGGGLAWQHLGRGAFLLLGANYCLVALCMFLSPVVQRVADHGHWKVIAARYWRILGTPRLFIFIPAWICINALVGVWLSSQMTFVLSNPLHSAHPHQLLMGSLSGPDAGQRVSFVLGGYVLFFGLCLLFWAFFLNKVSRSRLMFTSIVGVYLACVALEGINRLGLHGHWLIWVWLPLLLVGIFAETGFAPAALAYLADISESAAKDRGLVMGLYSIFLGVGQIVGNGFGGLFVRQFGFDGFIYLTCILAAIALGSLLWLQWISRTQSTHNVRFERTQYDL
jgi:MFS family permease